MAETILDLLFIFDLQLGSAPTYCNPAVKQILGYSTDDVDKSTRQIRDFLIHPDDLPAVQAVFSRPMRIPGTNSSNTNTERCARMVRGAGCECEPRCSSAMRMRSCEKSSVWPRM